MIYFGVSLISRFSPSELVVKDISLSIEAGQKIGLCGRTGR
jgi:ABC-type multidrug transport system fused ATPase/permease subunit